jgi:hypothetical protein
MEPPSPAPLELLPEEDAPPLPVEVLRLEVAPPLPFAVSWAPPHPEPTARSKSGDDRPMARRVFMSR